MMKENEAVDMAFEEYGGEGKPPVILLHGFFASSRNWRQIAMMLADSYHVYVPDLRNHGSSPHSDRMDYPAMAVDIGSFMHKYDLYGASLLGHSMGGKAAMWFALNNSASIRQLIIVDIAPVKYRHSFRNIIQALMDLPLEKMVNRKQADTFLSSSIPELSFRQFLLQNLLIRDGVYRWRIDLEVFLKSADKISGFPKVAANQSFSKQTLYIFGGDSQYLRSEDEAVIDTLFPVAIIQKLPGTGHWLHAEKPDLFVRTLREFLAK
jgi:esterase